MVSARVVTTQPVVARGWHAVQLEERRHPASRRAGSPAGRWPAQPSGRRHRAPGWPSASRSATVGVGPPLERSCPPPVSGSISANSVAAWTPTSSPAMAPATAVSPKMFAPLLVNAPAISFGADVPSPPPSFPAMIVLLNTKPSFTRTKPPTPSGVTLPVIVVLVIEASASASGSRNRLTPATALSPGSRPISTRLSAIVLLTISSEPSQPMPETKDAGPLMFPSPRRRLPEIVLSNTSSRPSLPNSPAPVAA